MLRTKNCQFILNRGCRYISVLSSKDLTGLEPSQVSKDGTTQIYTAKKKPLSQRLKTLGKNSWKKIDNSPYKRVEPPTEIEVATLAHDLQRVLFSPGVHTLKDPRTDHYNFSEYLEYITQPFDFDYGALQPYVTSSKDNSLIDMARSMNKKYVGSTSSVSSALSHFYFVMSNFKPVSTDILSGAFDLQPKQFTRGTRAPASIYLRWKDGVYAIDADKSMDLNETILSIMGKSLEKVLTLEPSDYERYLKANSAQISEEEKNQPEAFAYGELGDFLLRSQLDCHDARLPRGTFDLKTRAVMPVRLDVQNYSNYLGYSLTKPEGLFESFEREYYDMIRSAFLKYNFQVRIGHMDGILVAYHNTRKIFGFQYITREEMDRRLFGSSKIGNKVFTNALTMFNDVLNHATQKYPEQTLRISFDTKKGPHDRAFTRIFVETTTDEPESTKEPHENISLFQLSTRSYINGVEQTGPLKFTKPQKDNWTTRYRIIEKEETEDEEIRNMFRSLRETQESIYAPSKGDNSMFKLFEKISKRTLEKEREKELENSSNSKEDGSEPENTKTID
ncbi:Pet127-domain-containing protein [Backusella circina FSU 941]|nr:Pet127-domain-containing protein [Backusella circina FSU 941]